MYQKKADDYLNRAIAETIPQPQDPTSIAARSEYVTAPTQWVDPNSGLQLSEDEANQRVHDKNPAKKAELKMDEISIGGDLPPQSQSYLPKGESSMTEGVDPLSVTIADMERTPSSRMDPQSSTLIADLVAAGLPTVSGLLGGSSPAVMMNHYDRQHKYTNTRGAQLNPSKANMVELMGEDGNPYYELANNSLGKRPYKAPPRELLGGGLGGGAFGSPLRMYNPDTGQRVIAQGYKDGTHRVIGTGEVLPHGAWQQDMGVGAATGTDVYGNKIQDQFDKNAPQRMQNVKTTQGYGDALKGLTGNKRGVPTDTISLADKEIAQYEKDIAPFFQKKADIASRISQLDSSDRTHWDLGGLSNTLLQANTVETRLTDDDAVRARGGEFKSYAKTFRDFLGNKVAGKMTQDEVSAMKKAASNLMRISDEFEQAYRNQLIRRIGMLPGGQDYLNLRGSGPKTESTVKKEQAAKKLKKDVLSISKKDINDIETVAGKYFKKGSKEYNDFIEKTKNDYILKGK